MIWRKTAAVHLLTRLKDTGCVLNTLLKQASIKCTIAHREVTRSLP